MPAQRPTDEIFREACRIAYAKGLFILKEDAGPRTDYIVCRKLPGGRSTRLAKRGSIKTLHRYIIKTTTAE